MMVKMSKKTAALAISEKLNSEQKLKVCALQDIDYLITELEANESLLKPYQAAGVKTI